MLIYSNEGKKIKLSDVFTLYYKGAASLEGLVVADASAILGLTRNGFRIQYHTKEYRWAIMGMYLKVIDMSYLTWQPPATPLSSFDPNKVLENLYLDRDSSFFWDNSISVYLVTYFGSQNYSKEIELRNRMLRFSEFWFNRLFFPYKSAGPRVSGKAYSYIYRFKKNGDETSDFKYTSAQLNTLHADIVYILYNIFFPFLKAKIQAENSNIISL